MYGYYHTFTHETPSDKRFQVGVEVLLCHDGYKYRANEIATQGEPQLVPLRDCPMRGENGEPKPVISKLEREIKKVLDNRE